MGQAILPSHARTHTRGSALPPYRGHQHIIYTHGGMGDVTMGFWGAIRPSELPFLLIKQARRALPLTDKVSESKTRRKTWTELRVSLRQRKKQGTWRLHRGRSANLQKQTKR